MIRSLLVTFVLIFSVTPMTHMHLLQHEPIEMKSSEEVEPLGWLTSLGSSMNDEIYSILPLANNSYIAGGEYTPPITIGEDYHETIGFNDQDIDGFIAFLNETNEWNSSIPLRTVGHDTVNSLALVSDGDLIVAGTYCMGTLGQFCELTLGSLPALEKESIQAEGKIFVAKYNFENGWVWSFSVGNENLIQFTDMYIDEMDIIHLAFNFQGNIALNESEVLYSGFELSVGLIMVNADGNISNYHFLPSDGGAMPNGGICVNNDGETYLAVTFNRYIEVPFVGFYESLGGFDILVAKYNHSGWIWAQQAGGLLDDIVNGCVAGADSDVQLFGSIVGNSSFGIYSAGTTTGWDAFRADIGSDGTWKSLSVEQGLGDESFQAAYQTPSGTIIYAGLMTNQMFIGEENLTGYDEDTTYVGTDVILAEFDFSESWLWAINGGSEGRDQVNDISPSYNGSSIVAFSFEGSGVFGNHSITLFGGRDVGLWNYETDFDYDGILDGIDNCPRISNPEQENFDSDLSGDVCDEDDDNDGIADDIDVCPLGEIDWTSTSQTDYDGDGCRDSDEDFDDDNDTVYDHLDLCPKGSIGWISTPENDVEGDGCSDFDTDEDGYVDQQDNCPNIKNEGQEDLDGDLIGDVCDSDEDGDGIENTEDGCPRDLALWASSELNDWDRDGCHDDTNDQDDDSDLKIDNIAGEQIDSCPKGYRYWDASNLTLDHDQDGCHDDQEDDDDDDDGFLDTVDLCPRGLVGPVLPSQDFDTDGCVDGEEDTDDDSDGVLNADDACPRTSLDTVAVDGNGCSSQQADTDSDGVLNSDDFCPATIMGETVDEDGCTVIEEAETKKEATESSFGINQILILLALSLAGVAAYMTFKPVRVQSQESSEKAVPNLETQTETTEDGKATESESSEPEQATGEVVENESQSLESEQTQP